jgi:hypothetical protein
MKVKCHICGFERDYGSWVEFFGHLKGHVDRGEHRNLPVPGITGYLEESS